MKFVFFLPDFMTGHDYTIAVIGDDLSWETHMDQILITRGNGMFLVPDETLKLR